MGKKTINSLRKSSKKTSEDFIVNEEAKVDQPNEEAVANHEESQEKLGAQIEEEKSENTKRKRVRKRKASNIEGNQAIENDEQDSKVTTIQSNDESRFTNNCTIYIEGLPFDATEGQITTFFQSAGRIASIRLPRWHDSGRLRGYGHVEFEDSEGASKALELDGHYMGKRFIKVDRPMVPRLLQEKSKDVNQTTRPAGCRTIFIKNLPYDCEEQDLTAAFMFCGKIANVRLAVWNHTNQLKGFGYMEFKSEQSAEIAVKKSLSAEGILVKGRPTICDYETGQPKGSFKPRVDPSKPKKGSSKPSTVEVE